MMEQVHGNKVKVVGEIDKGKVIPGIDGMVTTHKGLILGIKVADCLPVLFYDPVGKIIGVAHAGWQGVLKRIAQKVVDLMIKKGSIPSNMLVGIGPRIGGCCYTVQNNRAERFLKEFGKLGNMVFRDKNGIHLDVAVPIVIQLIASGVLKENIFLPLTCTSCQNQEFFSYRKEHTCGRILGIIGLIN
jgi:YfiH family protein